MNIYYALFQTSYKTDKITELWYENNMYNNMTSFVLLITIVLCKFVKLKLKYKQHSCSLLL